MVESPDLREPAALARAVVSAARSAHATVATAESLTAGMIAATLAEVPGASAVLHGGVISYANSVKIGVLGVDAQLLEVKGSVDGEVARQMADGARKACGADLAVSATGVAGPDAHDGKGVGTVFIGYATKYDSGFTEHRFSGDRAAIRALSTLAALETLYAHVVPSERTA